MNDRAIDFSYVLTPLLAWLTAGLLKFLVNSARARSWAFGQIGYGGLPSNHSAIVCSMVALVGAKEGLSHPAFGVAVTLAFIVMLDASSLRRQIGLVSAEVNRLSIKDGSHGKRLRERVGHTALEIAAGALVGTIVGYAVAITGMSFPI